MSKKKQFIVDMRHDATGDPDLAVFNDYEKAVNRAHKFFLSYEFEVRDGKAFDPGHGDTWEDQKDVFDDVTMHGGKVAGFTHCGGDGPVCVIRRSE